MRSLRLSQAEYSDMTFGLVRVINLHQKEIKIFFPKPSRAFRSHSHVFKKKKKNITVSRKALGCYWNVTFNLDMGD